MKHYYLFVFFLLTLGMTPFLLDGQIAGVPDSTFGQAGQASITTPDQSYYGGPSVLLPDGKILVASYRYDQNFESGIPVFTRLLPDGSLDPDYGINGQAYPAIHAGDGGISRIAITATGKIIVAGNILTDSLEVAYAARLDDHGELDPSFGQGGIVTFDIGAFQDEFYTVLIKPDGKILLGGSSATLDNASFLDPVLIQILPDGTPDTTFGVGSLTTFDFPDGGGFIDLALQADGKIITVGSNYFDVEVARFEQDGTIDQSFGNDGALAFGLTDRFDVAYAVAIQNDQKIVLCGISFQDGTPIGEITLFRLQPDGSFDPAFGTNGQVFTDLGVLEFARALVLQPDGKILVGAESIPSATSLEGQFCLLRYNQNGSLDPTFGDNGRVKTPMYTGEPETAEVLLQPDGKIIHTGTADNGIVLWRYLNDPTVSVQETPAADFQLACLPNPVTENARLTWVLKASGEVRCDLYNMQGQLLQTLISPCSLSAGTYQQPVCINDRIPAGTYFLKLQVGNQQQVMSLLKM